MYLPRSEKNLGYAFVNFNTPQLAQAFKRDFHHKKLKSLTSRKVLEITYARLQVLMVMAWRSPGTDTMMRYGVLLCVRACKQTSIFSAAQPLRRWLYRNTSRWYSLKQGSRVGGSVWERTECMCSPVSECRYRYLPSLGDATGSRVTPLGLGAVLGRLRHSRAKRLRV